MHDPEHGVGVGGGATPPPAGAAPLPAGAGSGGDHCRRGGLQGGGGGPTLLLRHLFCGKVPRKATIPTVGMLQTHQWVGGVEMGVWMCARGVVEKPCHACICITSETHNPAFASILLLLWLRQGAAVNGGFLLLFSEWG